MSCDLIVGASIVYIIILITIGIVITEEDD